MDRYYGQVKWFKDQKGYGFITVMGCDGSDSDDPVLGKEIFVHHTDIQPTNSTYKTLIKGEYVSFSLKQVSRPQHSSTEAQAAEVRGAFGGTLMCDGLNVSTMTRMLEGSPSVLHNGDIMFSSGEDIIL